MPSSAARMALCGTMDESMRRRLRAMAAMCPRSRAPSEAGYVDAPVPPVVACAAASAALAAAPPLAGQRVRAAANSAAALSTYGATQDPCLLQPSGTPYASNPVARIRSVSGRPAGTRRGPPRRQRQQRRVATPGATRSGSVLCEVASGRLASPLPGSAAWRFRKVALTESVHFLHARCISWNRASAPSDAGRTGRARGGGAAVGTCQMAREQHLHVWRSLRLRHPYGSLAHTARSSGACVIPVWTPGKHPPAWVPARPFPCAPVAASLDARAVRLDGCWEIGAQRTDGVAAATGALSPLAGAPHLPAARRRLHLRRPADAARLAAASSGGAGRSASFGRRRGDGGGGGRL
eukprot:353747-Chlamydomonas_euryale.AAC.2